MSQTVQEFTDLLLKQGVISLDQLSEAEKISKDTGVDIGDVLVQSEYATPEEVALALAEFHKIPFVLSESIYTPRGFHQLFVLSHSLSHTLFLRRFKKNKLTVPSFLLSSFQSKVAS